MPHRGNGSLDETVTSLLSSSEDGRLSPQPFRAKSYTLTLSAIIGALSGLNIVVFKRSIDFLRDTCYGNPLIVDHLPLLFIPALGGLAVSILVLLGGDFPPGLRQTVEELDNDVLLDAGVLSPSTNGYSSDCVEERSDLIRYARKGLAAVFTLGTGNSLGPEGPAVEAGMSVSRLCTSVVPPSFLFGEDEVAGDEGGLDAAAKVIARNRLLLSCGAAAGLSAGFNAPLSGVFFALEIVQGALSPLSIPHAQDETSLSNSEINIAQASLSSESISISAILLSSVVSALVSKAFLGNELALHLSSYELKNPLVELPLYLLLGGLSGLVAVLFSGAAQFSKSVFAGTAGPEAAQDFFRAFPKWAKPLLGSIICGVVGLKFPQILFFGYETLNGLLASQSIPTVDLFALLAAKTFTTAVSAASGLVGGTFAPSLFLGGMLGAGFHNIAVATMGFAHDSVPWLGNVSVELSALPAYAMVGAASVLAALFRAPLTASLLLFECTRDYDVILPLMASAGVGSLVGDIIENALEDQRRDVDSVSWGDLAMMSEDADDGCIVEFEVEDESLPHAKS